MVEKLVASAIKFTIRGSACVNVMTGLRHPNIFSTMANLGIEYDKPSHVEGFWTNQDRFVDRVEAVDIAIAARQIPASFEKPYLTSEDIWL